MTTSTGISAKYGEKSAESADVMPSQTPATFPENSSFFACPRLRLWVAWVSAGFEVSRSPRSPGFRDESALRARLEGDGQLIGPSPEQSLVVQKQAAPCTSRIRHARVVESHSWCVNEHEPRAAMIARHRRPANTQQAFPLADCVGIVSPLC
jgi:hypothetical protein